MPCRECRRRREEGERGRCEPCKEKIREANRRRYRRAREFRERHPSICGTCYTRQSIHGFRSCGPCLARHRDRLQRSRERARQSSVLLCTRCYRHPATEGYRTCDQCLTRRRREEAEIKTYTQEFRECWERRYQIRYRCPDCHHERFIDTCAVCDFSTSFFI